MKNDEKGFSIVEIVMVILVVGLIGVVGWLVYDRQNGKDKASDSITNQSSSDSADEETAAPITEDVTPAEVTLGSCDGSYEGSGPISQSKIEPWKTKLSAAYSVYTVDQVCGLSDNSKIVTFKVEETRLPSGVAIFDASNNLLRHNKITCKSNGGEGARLWVTALKDKKIEAKCPSGHMGETVTQYYSFDFDSLAPTLLREQ